MEHKKTKVLYVSKNDGTDTRMSKGCNSLQVAGYEVGFVGWDRAPDSEKSSPIPDIEQHIFKYTAGFRSIGLVFSAWRYVFFLLKILKKENPEIVHSVNEDLTLLLILFKPFFRYRVICDIYDSFSLRYASSNFILRGAVNVLCKIAWHFSDAIIVTDEARRSRLKLRHNKSWIVPNFPVDPTNLVPAILRDHDTRSYLYVNGTLYSPRGLRQISNAIDQSDNTYVICAGWVFDDMAREFIKHPKVDFIGVVTPAESLAYAAACDAVVALYEPTDENMLLASPNKIYDAMCVGKPIIINSETKISGWVVESGIGYVCPYWDERALIEILKNISSQNNSNIISADHIRQTFEKGYSWQSAEYALLQCYSFISAFLGKSSR